MADRVIIVHDDAAAAEPFEVALNVLGVPCSSLLLDAGHLDLSQGPPKGVYLSRVSASAFSRGFPAAKDYGRAVLAWLEAHGRTVVNGTRALELELSKTRQLAALRAYGFDVPRTAAAFGEAELRERARVFPAPFVLKHNQGGQGTGYWLLEHHGALGALLESDEYEPPPDGITLVQEFVESALPFTTRAEFVGGEFLYAVAVDNERETAALRQPDIAGEAIVADLGDFLTGAGAQIAGVEYIETPDGRTVITDLNMTTDYYYAVETEAVLPGTRAVARYLGGLLA